MDVVMPEVIGDVLALFVVPLVAVMVRNNRDVLMLSGCRLPMPIIFWLAAMVAASGKVRMADKTGVILRMVLP